MRALGSWTICTTNNDQGSLIQKAGFSCYKRERERENLVIIQLSLTHVKSSAYVHEIWTASLRRGNQFQDEPKLEREKYRGYFCL